MSGDCNFDYFDRKDIFDDSNPDYDTQEQAEERHRMERKYGIRRDFTYGPDQGWEHEDNGQYGVAALEADYRKRLLKQSEDPAPRQVGQTDRVDLHAELP